MELLLLLAVVVVRWLLLLLVHRHRRRRLLVLVVPSLTAALRRRRRGRDRRVRRGRGPSGQRHAHVTHLQPLARQPVLGQRFGRAARRPAPAEHEIRVFRAALHFHVLRLARRRRSRWGLFVVIVPVDLDGKKQNKTINWLLRWIEIKIRHCYISLCHCWFTTKSNYYH